MSKHSWSCALLHYFCLQVYVLDLLVKKFTCHHLKPQPYVLISKDLKQKNFLRPNFHFLSGILGAQVKLHCTDTQSVIRVCWLALCVHLLPIQQHGFALRLCTLYWVRVNTAWSPGDFNNPLWQMNPSTDLSCRISDSFIKHLMGLW